MRILAKFVESGSGEYRWTVCSRRSIVIQGLIPEMELFLHGVGKNRLLICVEVAGFQPKLKPKKSSINSCCEVGRRKSFVLV